MTILRTVAQTSRFMQLLNPKQRETLSAAMNALEEDAVVRALAQENNIDLDAFLAVASSSLSSPLPSISGSSSTATIQAHVAIPQQSIDKIEEQQDEEIVDTDHTISRPIKRHRTSHTTDLVRERIMVCNKGVISHSRSFSISLVVSSHSSSFHLMQLMPTTLAQ